MRKLFQKPFFKKVLGPLFRSSIKTLIPPVGTAIEIGKNLLTPKGEKLPHSWTSIAAQIIFWGLILYAFGTKMITFWDAIDLLNFGE